MKTMKIKCNLHIGRPQGGGGPEVMTIEVSDKASHIQFLSLKIPLADFMKALTGQFLNEVAGEVFGLDVVGKTRVVEPREIVCPLTTYKQKELKEWLEANAQEDGWIVDSYLGSQSSVSRNQDGTLLRYRVHKFIDTEMP